MNNTETIFAPSSGTQRAGICVIRISGPGCTQAMRELKAWPVEPRKAALRSFCHPRTGELVDRGIVLWFPGPGSFTGEDVVELHIHGGRAVLEAMLDGLACLDGFRMAEAGEFSRRAFYNGKLDLSQAEALADLIAAETEIQRQIALIGLGDELVETYASWRSELLGCLAFVEAEIDFSDEEDVPINLAASVADRLAVLRDEIGDRLSDPRRGEIYREGFRVVLAGATNVGKSSLLNVLARRDVAIVSDIAGTTRDVNEVFLDLGGYAVVFTDTAGLREAVDIVEGLGIERTWKSLKEADLIVWVRDDENNWLDLQDMKFDSPALWVRNKCDLPYKADPAAGKVKEIFNVSTVSGAGIDSLLEAVKGAVVSRLNENQSACVLRRRHVECLSACAGYLDAALEYLSKPEFDIEFVAEELRLAARALGRISGQVDVEDLLDVVFGEFCIGK